MWGVVLIRVPYTLEFYRAKIEDAEEIYNILKLAGEHMLEKQGFGHWVPAYPLERIIEDIENSFVFIGKKDDKTIMTFTLGVKPYGFWLSRPCIKCLYSRKAAVLPEYGGCGYGIESEQFLQDFAIKEGYERIRCEVYDQNKRQIAYVKMFGYKEVGTAPTRRFQVVCFEKVL
jgi:GNAT superfamily N-acetyltransferase